MSGLGALAVYAHYAGIGNNSQIQFGSFYDFLFYTGGLKAVACCVPSVRIGPKPPVFSKPCCFCISGWGVLGGVFQGNKPLENKRAPMYNEPVMEKSDVVYHLKGRWENIARKENEALMEASYEERLVQTAALMDFAKHFRRHGEEDRDVERVRKTWNKLKAGRG